jgi:hypothetical protein
MREGGLTVARILFFEKIPQTREFNDVVRRQNRANQIRLWRGVNFIQMMLRFGLRHKLPDALVESAFDDHRTMILIRAV